MLNAKTDLERSSQVPAPELERRISAVIGLFKSRTEAASVCGMSTDQLSRYEKGGTPSFPPLARLAIAKGVSLEWLATGEGGMLLSASQTASDGASQALRLEPETLESSIAAVDAGLGALDVTLQAGDKARLVMVVYRRLVERQLQPAEVVAAVLQSIKNAVKR